MFTLFLYIILLYFEIILYIILYIMFLYIYSTLFSGFFIFSFISLYSLTTLFTEINSSWLIYKSIKALEIKNSIVFNSVFAKNTILLCYFCFFLMIDLYRVIARNEKNSTFFYELWNKMQLGAWGKSPWNVYNN